MNFMILATTVLLIIKSTTSKLNHNKQWRRLRMRAGMFCTSKVDHLFEPVLNYMHTHTQHTLNCFLLMGMMMARVWRCLSYRWVKWSGGQFEKININRLRNRRWEWIMRPIAFVILARKREVWQNYYVTKHKLYETSKLCIAFMNSQGCALLFVKLHRLTMYSRYVGTSSGLHIF